MAGSMNEALKPMNIKEIAKKAQEFDFNPLIPLKFWIRTSDTLLREALIYEQEDNDQQAYLLFLRYASLITEKLPLHPSAKDPEFKQALKSIQRTLPKVLDTLETLKPRINSRYSAWKYSLESKAEVSDQHDRLFVTAPYDFTSSSDPAIAGNHTTLAAAENSELAVRLAHQEIRRRDAFRQSAQNTVISEQEQERQTAGVWDNWEAELSKNRQLYEEGARSKVQQPPQLIQNSFHELPQEEIQSDKLRSLISPNISGYRYPLVAKSRPLLYQNAFQKEVYCKNPTSPNPSKRPSVDLVDPQKTPPPLPQKSPIDLPPALFPPQSLPSSPPAFTFRPSSYLENGKPLRTVFLPPGLRIEFLRQVESNTYRNLETCGMLCGTLISNALFIRRVVIPDQESTSDTCETTNEGAIFDYCDKEDLMVLGWIHTHPTQTCFMSSRDLHTHCGYQIMMPESIAIVCAPSKTPSWGVFRLTDPQD